MVITKQEINKIYRPRDPDLLKVMVGNKWYDLVPQKDNEEQFYKLYRNCRLKMVNYTFKINNDNEVVEFKLTVPDPVANILRIGEKIK